MVFEEILSIYSVSLDKFLDIIYPFPGIWLAQSLIFDFSAKSHISFPVFIAMIKIYKNVTDCMFSLCHIRI